MPSMRSCFYIPDYVPCARDFWDDGRSSRKNQMRYWFNNAIHGNQNHYGTSSYEDFFIAWCLSSCVGIYELECENDPTIRLALWEMEKFYYGQTRYNDIELWSRACDVSGVKYFNKGIKSSRLAWRVKSAIDERYDKDRLSNFTYAATNYGNTCENISRALTLFVPPKTSIVIDDDLRAMCRFFMEKRDANCARVVADKLIELGFPEYDHRVKTMINNPECMALGMWPFCPHIAGYSCKIGFPNYYIWPTTHPDNGLTKISRMYRSVKKSLFG